MLIEAVPGLVHFHRVPPAADVAAKQVDQPMIASGITETSAI
jgi:hypothetical protein